MLHAIVTAGPTRERMDPVRYISNDSSGKQGYAITQALLDAGVNVTLVTGPVSEPVPSPLLTPLSSFFEGDLFLSESGVPLERSSSLRKRDFSPMPSCHVVRVESADQMLLACEEALPADIFIACAAVCDWKVENVSNNKLKKRLSDDKLVIEYVKTPDILATISRLDNRPKHVVGFAAETSHLAEYAANKRLVKGCDWIVANDVSDGVFGSDYNAVMLIKESGVESWPKLSKPEVAERLVAEILSSVNFD